MNGQPAGAVKHPVVPTALLYPAATEEQLAGLSKIKHIVFIVQENRSFDHYFGTYPGAEGIPMKKDGKTPSVCVKHPTNGSCVKPYHDKGFVDAGGPHHAQDAHDRTSTAARWTASSRRSGRSRATSAAATLGDPRCQPGTVLPDVHGLQDRREIPNYWTYADDFVLQDHMFEPVRSCSLPAHLYLVSAWSAQLHETRTTR